MNLNEIKRALTQVEEVNFILPDGKKVPSHFHVTEVGGITKNFIDCGGTLRNESWVSFQLYTAQDYDHRLAAQKLKEIIDLSEQKLGLTNEEIEVEYQGDTIGKYGISFDGQNFHLNTKFTDCLAKDKCGIPSNKPKVSIKELNTEVCCTPGSGCC